MKEICGNVASEVRRIQAQDINEVILYEEARQHAVRTCDNFVSNELHLSGISPHCIVSNKMIEWIVNPVVS